MKTHMNEKFEITMEGENPLERYIIGLSDLIKNKEAEQKKIIAEMEPTERILCRLVLQFLLAELKRYKDVEGEK